MVTNDLINLDLFYSIWWTLCGLTFDKDSINVEEKMTQRKANLPEFTTASSKAENVATLS